MSEGFKIGKRKVGPREPCFVVAEVAQAHDGSFGAALEFINVAAQAGADAVKFQTHIAAAESTAREPFRVKFSRQDRTRYDYWKRMEFTPKQWRDLALRAADRGLIFLSSPFSLEAFALLQQLKVPAWKIGSGELGNTPLIDAMIASRKPILLSSGMASWKELDAAVKKIRAARVPLMVYQCTTKYPCKPGEVGLALIRVMRERYNVPVGLSDHSGTAVFGIAAAALGAASVEVHITMSRQSFGPDVPASLTPAELAEMVRGIRAVEKDLRSPPDKNKLAVELAESRRIFGRSIVTSVAVPKGTRLTRKHLTLKKPACGMTPADLNKVIGRRAARKLAPDTFISRRDLA